MKMKVAIIVLVALVYTASCATTAKPSPTSAKPSPTTGKPGPTTEAPNVHRDKLIEKAKQLEKAAEAEIKILTAEGKTAAADQLKQEEANLKKLISELVAVTEPHQLKKIEHEVSQAENRLKEQINKDKAHDKASTPSKTSSAKPTSPKPSTPKPTSAKPASPTSAKPTSAKPNSAKPTSPKPTSPKPTPSKPSTAK